MKLSIVTCTYNSEKYLGECIQGITNQNIDPTIFEHIFVDGKSSDKTINIIEKYKADYPDYNIQLIEAEPKGVYNAMNTGIKNSSGEYVMFCNSDDYLEEDTLKKYIKYIDDTHDKDIYYARFNVKNDGILMGVVPFSNTLKLCLRKLLFFIGFNTLVYHPTTIIKKSLFDELGLYDETQKIASDYGFWLACLKAKKSFTYFPHVVSNFRVHAGSLTSNPENKQREWSENLYFRKKYLGIWGLIIHNISLLLYNMRGKK